MGNKLSLVSTSFGFISFPLTLATLLNVFWGSMMTIKSAPEEIDNLLGALKRGLYEERAHLRRARRRLRRRARGPSPAPPPSRGGTKPPNHHGGPRRNNSKNQGQYQKYPPAQNHQRRLSGDEKADRFDLGNVEDISIRTMRDSVRELYGQFKVLEEPFLRDAERQRRDADRNGYADADEDPEEWYRTDYRRCGVAERWAWLRSKKDVQDVLDSLNRLRTRRVSMEVADLAVWMEELRGGYRVGEGQMGPMHPINPTNPVVSDGGRMERVVGVRVVDQRDERR